VKSHSQKRKKKDLASIQWFAPFFAARQRGETANLAGEGGKAHHDARTGYSVAVDRTPAWFLVKSW
jgi:hypothetical protein